MPYSKISFLVSIILVAAANGAAYGVLLDNAFSRGSYRRSGAIARTALFISEGMMYPMESLRLIWPFSLDSTWPILAAIVILIEAFALHKVITALRAMLASG